MTHRFLLMIGFIALVSISCLPGHNITIELTPPPPDRFPPPPPPVMPSQLPGEQQTENDTLKSH